MARITQSRHSKATWPLGVRWADRLGDTVGTVAKHSLEPANSDQSHGVEAVAGMPFKIVRLPSSSMVRF